MSNGYSLVGVREDWRTQDGEVYRVYDQEINPAYWAGLDYIKEKASNGRCSDLHCVYDVPTIFVEKWLRQGFSVYEQPVKEVLKKLRQEDLGDFIVSRKSV